MRLHARFVPLLRLVAVAVIVAGAAAWRRPRADAVGGAQVCRGGVYTLTVENGTAGHRPADRPTPQ